MYFVSKNSKKRIRVLDADERLILKDSDKFSDDRKEKFALFLSNVKKQYWIECNCNVGDAFLVIYSARHKILVRCKERKGINRIVYSL